MLAKLVFKPQRLEPVERKLQIASIKSRRRWRNNADCVAFLRTLGFIGLSLLSACNEIIQFCAVLRQWRARDSVD
ncbi:MAG: hypothetical protein IPP97_17610 [Candidatus Obscuribacter sp.]|nr:hypothetical protein [Candidatus Obscuribacter sp.]